MSKLAYDVIGDIHGHAAYLEALLARMGYVQSGSGYRPPTGRQAVFLGDLIDRGPDQTRVLSIVRSMVDAGHARCIMGNHEHNAVGFITPDPGSPGEMLRPNVLASPKGRKNREQHAGFLAQVGEGSTNHRAWVDWFKTLPPFLDLDGIRVVHGSWDAPSVDVCRDAGWTEQASLDGQLLIDTFEEGALKDARKRLTCGLELELPAGRFILDKAGHRHPEVRVADWRHDATDFSQVALVPAGNEALLDDMEWPAGLELKPIEGSPVLIGHHWFNGSRPLIESPKLACLDWSAARGGVLAAYRWDGEDELSNDKLVWVRSP